MGTTTESSLPSECILAREANETVYKVWLLVLLIIRKGKVKVENGNKNANRNI
jgi:hypothetical protein